MTHVKNHFLDRDSSEVMNFIHTGVRRFTRDTCGHSFAHSGTLKRDNMIHTGDKPFTCGTCGKSFAQSGQLKCHAWTHTGIKGHCIEFGVV